MAIRNTIERIYNSDDDYNDIMQSSVIASTYDCGEYIVRLSKTVIATHDGVTVQYRVTAEGNDNGRDRWWTFRTINRATTCYNKVVSALSD